MSVTELARLNLQPGTDASSPAFLANLAKAKDAMEEASGFKFWYYHCVEDPTAIFIFGAWPSVDFHMQDSIPSQANQELLVLLKDQITVEWMFHLDIDHSEHPLPLDRKLVTIGRHLIKEGNREAFKLTFVRNKHELETFAGINQVVGGWRIDKGYDPSAKRDSHRDEFVLFTAWNSVEHHFEFAKTEGFQTYSEIGARIDGTDIIHAKPLEVGKEAGM